jgi:pyruvate/2-oxoglutarate dehydrogenase complex dihydrolipoamide acyltransferase (E2) component
MSIVTEVKIPVENVNDLTAKVLAWRVPNGATVKQGEAISELETTKASFEVFAPCAGVVEYSWPEGAEVPVGETLCQISSDKEMKSPVIAIEPSVPPQVECAVANEHKANGNGNGKRSSGPVFSKKAERLLSETGLSSDLFKEMVLVKEADVREKQRLSLGGDLAVTRTAADGIPIAAVGQPKMVTPSLVGTAAGEKVSLGRAKIFENRELLSAARSVLKSSISVFCPAAGLDLLCQAQKPPIKRLPLILYETAKLLKKFPYLNACCVDDEHALLYQEINPGFAVDMGRGLKVLVIPNADKLTFGELSAVFDELLVKYATDTLELKDVNGSTFTVTDLAQEGVFNFDPLINSRQSAILGIGADGIDENGEGVGFMLNCAFDHRLTGGKQVAEFLRELSMRLSAHRKSFQEKEAAANPACCSRCLQTVEQLRRFEAMLVSSIEPKGYVCSLCLRGIA